MTATNMHPRGARDVDGTRIVFAPGAIRDLRSHIGALGLHRAFVITTGGRSVTGISARALLGDDWAGEFSGAREHVPVAAIAAALDQFSASDADSCIAIGGGSAIGLGKAIARRTSVPLVAVPTTYSGSEMTPIWGETDDTGKRTGRDPAAKPALVIYDVMLTLGLPADLSAASGMNAMAHAVEAMYAANATDAVRVIAEGAARHLSMSLPMVVADIADVDARAQALAGAHMAGLALGSTSMGLHHRICHVLGGTFGLPHARTHATMLPHVTAFNAPAATEAMTRLSRAISCPDVATGLTALNQRLGLPATLEGLGFRRDDVDRAAEEVTAAPYANPRPVTRDDVRAILLAAY